MSDIFLSYCTRQAFYNYTKNISLMYSNLQVAEL